MEWIYSLPYSEAVIFGNSVYRWIMAIAALFFLMLFLRILRESISKRLEKISGRSKNGLDDLLVSCLKSTGSLFIFLFSVFLAAQLIALSEPARLNVSRLFILVLLVQGGLWASIISVGLITRHVISRSSHDPSSTSALGLLTFLAKTLVWSAVVLLVLDNIGIDITALIAGLGVGGIAVALAVQNILGDLFASLSIILDKPFEVGDFITVDGYLGSVERIGVKTTRLRSLSGEQLVFSNSDLLASRIRNYKLMYERRVVFTVNVVYETPIEKLKIIPDILKAAITSQENVRLDRAHLFKLGSSSVDYEIVYYVLQSDYNVYMDIQQSINFHIMEQFKEEGIEFAYPTQTLYLARHEGLNLEELAGAS